MSLRTPIFTASPEIWAEADVASPSMAPMVRARPVSFIKFRSQEFLLRRIPLHAEILVQLGGIPRKLFVVDHIDDLSVFDDIMAIGKRGGEMEVLLYQQNRKTLLLQPSDYATDLLDNDRRETLGRLVE